MSRSVKIKDIAVLNKETFKKASFPRIIKYLDTGSLTKNKIEGFQLLNTETDIIPSRAQRKVFENTILYSTVRPNQEHYGIIERNFKSIVVSTGFTTIDINEKNISPKFIYYLLTQKHITDYLHTIGMNAVSSYPSISPEDIGNLKFNLPPLPTQKSIAKVLSDLDAKIELNNKINTELEAMAKTLYDYWFVQFEFPVASTSSATEIAKGSATEIIEGLVTSNSTAKVPELVEGTVKPYKSSGGKMVYNEELKREIPEGWEVKSIEKICKVVKGTLITEKTADLNGEIKVVSAGLDYSYFHSESNFDKFVITISASGANAGFVNFWREPIFANDCTVVQNKNIGITYFVYEYLKLVQDYIYKQAKGSAQPHVYPKDIEVLKIAYPNSDRLMKLYEESILYINEQISNNHKQNQQLSSLRDWLLPMLMNGQVAVRQAHDNAVK